MPLFLLKLGRWLLSKGVLYGLVAALAVAVFALWIFAKRGYESEELRLAELDQLQGQAARLYGELEATHERLNELGEGIEETRRKMAAANQTIALLDGILKRLERLVTFSAEERAEAERELAEAKAAKAAELRQQNALVSEQSRLRVDRVRLTEQAKDLESRISELSASSSQFAANLMESWNTLKPYLIVALASAILLPILWKLFAFYVWAPLLSRSGPIRISSADLPNPSLSASGVSTQLTLEKGQRIWVKESFLQASDECLSRRTRFVLNWSIPATCLAAGLIEMVELASEEATGAITVSPQGDAELEVAVVELPEGGQIVARPSCIAGLVSRDGEPVAIARRWRLFHPQAWLTFQFRYFVFQGPCALIVAGVRGVRFEKLDTQAHYGRRSNQIATLGFTPDLAYGVVRAETFWSYFRKFNPLFDDVFRGRGVFLCQEISKEEASRASRFWSGFWNSLLKVLGI